MTMPPELGIFSLPLDEDLRWRDAAECRNLSPERQKRFFVKDDEVKADEFIQSLCDHCEVREPCLDWALRHNEQGFWGGATERERRKMKRRARQETRSA